MCIDRVVSPGVLLSMLFTERVKVLLLEPVLKVLRVVEIVLRRFKIIILSWKLHTLELVVVEADVQRVRCQGVILVIWVCLRYLFIELISALTGGLWSRQLGVSVHRLGLRRFCELLSRRSFCSGLLSYLLLSLILHLKLFLLRRGFGVLGFWGFAADVVHRTG